MKKFMILMVILIETPLITNAQIPNGGFENWETEKGIEIPAAPWITNNLQPKPNEVTYNPVTKSTDHYPADVGNYSLKMENNIAYISEPEELLPFWACSYGYATTAFYPGYTGPAFPINGHPESLCGYYKFLPQNNDTMSISIALYDQGTMVSFAVLLDTTTASDWTSFCLPFPAYITADSAQIGFSAFYAGLGPQLPKAPYGNSIVYIDNLSFDNLITTSVNGEQGTLPVKFKLKQNYPNPFNPETTIEYSVQNAGTVSLSIYNISGQQVKILVDAVKPVGKYSISWDGKDYSGNNVTSGTYYYQLRTSDYVSIKKMILIK